MTHISIIIEYSSLQDRANCIIADITVESPDKLHCPRTVEILSDAYP